MLYSPNIPEYTPNCDLSRMTRPKFRVELMHIFYAYFIMLHSSNWQKNEDVPEVLMELNVLKIIQICFFSPMSIFFVQLWFFNSLFVSIRSPHFQMWFMTMVFSDVRIQTKGTKNLKLKLGREREKKECIPFWTSKRESRTFELSVNHMAGSSPEHWNTGS